MRLRGTHSGYLANQRGDLGEGTWGRTALIVAQTLGTIALAAIPGAGPFAAAGAAIGHAAFWMWYDSRNQDDTVNRQESLADLRIQSSTFGQAIPQVFGGDGTTAAARVAGNVIWATNKIPIEHRETTRRGGKGGGAKNVSITLTYDVYLAIALCDTRLSGPVVLRNIWKNSNLLGPTLPDNWTFYPGSASQAPDPIIESLQGAGTVPAYRYLAYIVMAGEDLGPSGQVPQWSFEVGQEGDEQLLTTVTEKMANAAGLTGAALDVSALPVQNVSLMLTSIEAIRASLEQLTLAYRFYGLETGTVYAFRPVGAGAIVATILEADTSAGEDQASARGALVERLTNSELPTIQYLTYVDAGQHFQRNTQPSAVVLPPSGRENPRNLGTPLVLTPDQARHLSTEAVALAWAQREPVRDTLPRRYCALEPGDKINLQARGLTYPLVLDSTAYGVPGLIEVQGRVNGAPRLGTVDISATTPIDGSLRDTVSIPPGAVVTPPAQTPPVPGDTTALLRNLPVLGSSDQLPRYHVGYVGSVEPWPGGTLYRSVDGSATFQEVDSGILEAISGNVPNALPTVADWTVRDDTNVMRVVLQYGELATVNDAANAAGAQRAMVGNEMVYIGTATLVATREYDCTKLWRGRQGTELLRGTHTTNEAFLLLDESIHGVSMTTAERGTSFPFKAVSRGQDIAAVTAVNFTPTAFNLIPWAVLPPLASRPVDVWQLRWYMRPRFVPGGQDPDFLHFAVTIYADNTFTTIKRTITTTGGYALEPTVLKGLDYSTTLQVADFGAIQTTLYWKVIQVGTSASGLGVNQTSTDLSTVQGAIEDTSVPGITTWIEVTATSYAMTVNHGFITNNAALVTLTLPATAIVGDVMEVAGKGAGGWRIAQNASQRIHIGRKATTVGVTGSVTARHVHDACRLVCIVAGASTEWDLVSFA